MVLSCDEAKVVKKVIFQHLVLLLGSHLQIPFLAASATLLAYSVARVACLVSSRPQSANLNGQLNEAHPNLPFSLQGQLLSLLKKPDAAPSAFPYHTTSHKPGFKEPLESKGLHKSDHRKGLFKRSLRCHSALGMQQISTKQYSFPHTLVPKEENYLFTAYRKWFS